MSDKRYPPCDSKQVINAALQMGYHIAGKKGSHVTLKRDDPPHTITVPAQGELKTTGTRIAIIKALARKNPDKDVRALIYGKKRR